MNTAYNSYSSKVNLILLLAVSLLYVFDFYRYLLPFGKNIMPNMQVHNSCQHLHQRRVVKSAGMDE